MKDTDQILHLLSKSDSLSSSEIYEKLSYKKSSRTLVRLLDKLVDKKLVVKTGANKGTKYSLSNSYGILHSIDINEYFTQDIDDREIVDTFNSQLIKQDLYELDLFTDSELLKLEDLQQLITTDKFTLNKKSVIFV
ncbi:hypothetical protein ACE193_09130 [Bernardetia sp. OM2101]|uniref:hypothetical protein n=1 Tax=Bernardetia sp. OM2101 TaxID=3344876 RepID=UPI0035CFA188